MKKLFNTLTPLSKIVFVALTVIAVGLIVGGFFVPPLGVVDGSVLKAVGELFGFAALWVIAHAIFENGANVKIEHGNTTVAIDIDDEDDDEEEAKQ